jgi:hypothetical protein
MPLGPNQRVSKACRAPRRSRWPAWPGWLALACLACESLVDPALPDGATVLTPPAVYARWWAMTEACSGRSGDLNAVTWYVATGSPSISNGSQGDLAGYYSPVSNRIVLSDTADLDGATIRHEMLHALLGPSVSGHPRDEFLGRCAGTVSCVGSCVTDGGPPPAIDPASVTVGPEVLRVSGVVDPAAPTRDVVDGWFTFTVLVTNPRSTPVHVALAPSGDAGPPVSFSWDVECLPRLQPCGNVDGLLNDERVLDEASVARFAPGETKRFVVDFQIDRSRGFWTMSPGAYTFTGFYNGRVPGHASAPDTAFVGP